MCLFKQYHATKVKPQTHLGQLILIHQIIIDIHTKIFSVNKKMTSKLREKE